MNTTISTEKIQSTEAYKALNHIQQEFAVKRANRLIISNALIVAKNNGVVPGNVVGYNLRIVEELLGESVKFKFNLIQQIEKETDESAN